MPALETLNLARGARAVGGIERCSTLAAAALSEATHEHDHETAYHAAACVGRAYVGRGEPDLALGHYRHALDLVLTHGLTQWIPNAYHDLGLALRETGARRQWKEKAAVAFQVYRDQNPRAPGITGIIADLAQDAFEHDPADRDKAAYALQAWRAVPASMDVPHYRLNAAANQMAAATTLGVRSRYDAARDALERFFGCLPDHEHAALTLAHAGRAACRMSEYEDAAVLGERALLIGEGRGELRAVEHAQLVIEAANAESVALLAV